MRIRRATAADIEVLAALHGACFEEAWGANAFQGLLEAPGTVVLLCPDGFAVARAAGDESEILTIGVLPAARRAGHARALLGAAAREAHRLGAVAMFLEVGAANIAARRLYEQAGFRQTGLRKGYYRKPRGQSEDALILRAELPMDSLGPSADLD